MDKTEKAFRAGFSIGSDPGIYRGHWLDQMKITNPDIAWDIYKLYDMGCMEESKTKRAEPSEEQISLLSRDLSGKILGAIGLDSESANDYLIIKFQDGSIVRFRYDYIYEYDFTEG